MAKRVLMIAPYEILSGNASGKQDLLYPTHDNKAYEAPVGKHYATNGKPSYIICQRKSDGRAYFQVKRRYAIKVTATQKKNWAVTGACGAIVGAILDNKSSELYIKLMQLYDAGMRSVNGKQSFRAMLSDTIMKGLRAKQSLFFFVGPAGGQIVDASLNNPFVSGGTAPYDVTISNEVLTKFWSELANNPITFTIEGQTGVAHSGDTFATLIASRYNVLGLTSAANPEGDVADVVKSGDMFVDYINADEDQVTALVADSTSISASYILSTQYHQAG